MRLIRHGAPGAERPGLVDAAGVPRDLAGHLEDIRPDLLTAAELERLRGLDGDSLPRLPDGVRYGPPLAGIGNLLCIGLNYASHAAEAGMAQPPEPVLFSKHTGAVAGAHDPIPLPRRSARADWEVELAVVIGAPAWEVPAERAAGHILGYMAANDVSERDWQTARNGQWIKGKSAPGFAPLGPWLVTADAVPDPQALGLGLSLNGEEMQRGTTADMIVPVAGLIAYLSQFLRLLPGDVILTGTPPGVGMGRTPPRHLRDGDVVEPWVDGLGRQRQVVRSV